MREREREPDKFLIFAFTCFRMADANVRGGNNNAEVAKDGDFSSATTGSKTDEIEILMSQMHDLSFMLESNLSIK